jgi:2,3-bisphosphoglycerate-dependent phosphoglycerate mutase
MTGKLVIVRHGESLWNAQGKWTGTRNVHLSARGKYEAELMGQTLGDMGFDHAFYTDQIRTTETLKQILRFSPTPQVPLTLAPELDERDYGIYTGKNKWEVKEAIGEDAFQELRRSWDYPIPEGETIKDVYARAVPYYLSNILPLVIAGKSVLIVAHGNSIRALMKYLESISDDDISQVEMIFGTALIYEVDSDGRMKSKTIRSIDISPPPA